MNDKFDELAKGMAQSVTRRGALRKFGIGLASVSLAMLGLPITADARVGKTCNLWQCRRINEPIVFYEYVCGGGRPKVNHNFAFCSLIGTVDCSYCSNCC
jgi:hypothetical protein